MHNCHVYAQKTGGELLVIILVWFMENTSSQSNRPVQVYIGHVFSVSEFVINSPPQRRGGNT